MMSAIDQTPKVLIKVFLYVILLFQISFLLKFVRNVTWNERALLKRGHNQPSAFPSGIALQDHGHGSYMADIKSACRLNTMGAVWMFKHFIECCVLHQSENLQHYLDDFLNGRCGGA